LQEVFWDFRIGCYLVTEVLKRRIMSIFKHLVMDAIEDKTVALDMGCGDGRYSVVGDNGFDGKMLAGLDNDFDLLKENHSIENRVLTDTHKLPFRKDSFDLIFTREVIEHVKNPGEIFFEAARVLKQNGTLIIQTPNKLHPISLVSSIVSLKTKARLKTFYACR